MGWILPPITLTKADCHRSIATMKQTIIALLAAAAFVGQAAATINKGVAHYTDGHSDQAVWIDGEDACDYVYMGP